MTRPSRPRHAHHRTHPRRRRPVIVAALVAALLVGAVAGPGRSTFVGRADATTARPNLLSGTNATFTTSRGTWSALGGSAFRVTTPSHSSGGALAVRRTGTSSGLVVARSGHSTATWTSAVPGRRYAATAWMRGPGRYVVTRLQFYASDGTPVASAAGQPWAEVRNHWIAVPSAVAVAPPTTAYVEVQLGAYHAAAGERHLIDDVRLVTARGGSHKLVGPLHTHGNEIVNVKGKRVVLRGFNRSGLERDATMRTTADEIGWAKTWGSNAIRINLGEQFWLAASCDYDSAYRGRIDKAVREITGRGMLAILDLHYVTTTLCGVAGNYAMADRANAPTFWRQVANRYKGNPLVAFDLYNEPHWISDSIWRNGGLAPANASGTHMYAVSGMQRLYDVVRGTGARNLVIVSGNHWAAEPSSLRVRGYNIVYSGHVYTCQVNPPPTCSYPHALDPTALLERWLDLSASKPFVVGEFGWPDPDDGRFAQAVIDFAEKHRWGWLQFSWQPGTYGPYDPFRTAGAGEPYEPKPAGVPALAAFRGSSGTDSLLHDIVDIRVSAARSAT